MDLDRLGQFFDLKSLTDVNNQGFKIYAKTANYST